MDVFARCNDIFSGVQGLMKRERSNHIASIKRYSVIPPEFGSLIRCESL